MDNRDKGQERSRADHRVDARIYTNLEKSTVPSATIVRYNGLKFCHLCDISTRLMVIPAINDLGAALSALGNRDPTIIVVQKNQQATESLLLC